MREKPEYELSAAAERDLVEIVLYTLETWGMAQTQRYEAALERHLAAIGRDDVRSRSFLEHRPEFLVTRCEHHYVFFCRRESARPLILAVFHENMDLMARLRDRLDPLDDR